MILPPEFFDNPPVALAQALLGKVLRHKVGGTWLSARIIETEAYSLDDRASHSSLGWTQARSAMFMPAGTIYMYFARGADSLNFSAKGDGNAVLIKSAVPVLDHISDQASLELMRELNPINGRSRSDQKLCAGQTLLCRSLGLKVAEWNAQTLDQERFYLDEDGYYPEKIVQCRRLGIPVGRDEDLMYRFIDEAFVASCTSNPLTRRSWTPGKDYVTHAGMT